MREGSEGLRATALEAWVGARAAGLDHAGACAAVVAALDAGPWAILAAVTPLARSPVAPAPEDLALDARLRRVPPGSRSAVVRFAAGAPCPAPDPASRKARGAFEIVRVALEPKRLLPPVFNEAKRPGPHWTLRHLVP